MLFAGAADGRGGHVKLKRNKMLRNSVSPATLLVPCRRHLNTRTPNPEVLKCSLKCGKFTLGMCRRT